MARLSWPGGWVDLGYAIHRHRHGVARGNGGMSPCRHRYIFSSRVFTVNFSIGYVFYFHCVIVEYTSIVSIFWGIPRPPPLYPPGTTTTLGSRNFAVTGAKVWNSLPVDLRLLSRSLRTFGHELKHYLFVSEPWAHLRFFKVALYKLSHYYYYFRPQTPLFLFLQTPNLNLLNTHQNRNTNTVTHYK